MDDDTGIGGQRDRFPRTRASIIESAQSGDGETRRRAHSSVVESYWKPVYTYLRYKWRASNEDAKDLTQGFFAHAIDSPFFGRFDPAKAKFRTYLRVCLDGYVAKERQAAGRLKRGGGAEHLPIDADFDTAEGDWRRLEIADHEDPDAVFRREWIRSLFGLAVDELRKRCAERGRDVHFRVFERYDLDPEPGARVSYAGLAEEMGLPVTQVTNYLASMRREFRALLLERLRELSGSEQEFREDVRDILGVDEP